MIELDKTKLEEYCAEVFTEEFIKKLIKINKERINAAEEMPLDAQIEEAKYE